ncbi:MAG: metal ABC transporter solute-binding protein, Zn/Mn family [Tenuifilaceae bacterium]
MMTRLILIILVIIGFIGCTSNKKAETNSKSTISVSILPQKYIIDRLTDSTIEVNVMVPPGTSPEMYEPSPVQMKNVANSLIYFAVGPLEFENAILPKIKELNPTIKFVNQSENISLIEGHEHHAIMGEQSNHTCYDPHVWTSTREYKQMTKEAFTVLCELFPEKEPQFNSNYSKIINDIDSLDVYIKNILLSAKTKNFLIYHPALSYFARDYGLNQISIEEDGKNPSAKKMANLVKAAKAEGLKTVFIQSQFDSHNAEILAMELGGDIIKIDPLGYDWLTNMYDLANNLSVALGSSEEKKHE